MVKFIGLSGKKQVGKDTAAAMIREEILRESKVVMHATEVITFPFAESLKDMVSNVFGINPELCWGTNEQKETPTHVLWDGLPASVRIKYSLREEVQDEYPYDSVPVPRSGPMTVRELLQVMGTDIFRERVYGQVWAEAPFRQPWEDRDVVLLPDCRFPNEKQIIEENGGFVIRIDRDTGFNDTHPSETSLDEADFVYRYQNEGTMDELRSFVRACLSAEGLI